MERITNLQISELKAFKKHPFNVRRDDAFLELLESVKLNGIINPIIVRSDGECYEIISGHRRYMAAKELEYETVPVIIKDLSDDDAIIFMIDSNIYRENILPSERATAYLMKYESLKKLGQKGKKRSRFNAIEILASDIGEDKTRIKRYIRLTKLIPELLRLVDEKVIAITPGVELSFLKEKEQLLVFEFYEKERATPSLSQAMKLKRISQDDMLNRQIINSVLSEKKPNQKEKMVLKTELIAQYIPEEYTTKDVEELVAKLIKNWSKKFVQ